MTLLSILLFFRLTDYSSSWFFTQDKHDNVWVNSAQSWNKYDGAEMCYYLQENDDYIQSKLFEDERGNLYGSSYKALLKYDVEIDSFIKTPLSYQNHTLKKDYHVFYIDTLAQLIYLTADQKVLIYNYQNEKIEALLFGSKSKRFTVSEDQNIIVGNLWSTGSGIEVFKKVNAEWKKETLLQNIIYKGGVLKPHIKKSYFIKDDLWLISNIGLIKYNLVSKKYEVYNLSNSDKLHLNDAIVYEERLFLAVKNQGIQIFNLSKEEFEENKYSFQNSSALRSSSPLRLFIDKNSNLWITYDKLPIQRFSLLYDINPILTIPNLIKIESSRNNYYFVSKTQIQIVSKDLKHENLININSVSPQITEIRDLSILDENTIAIIGNKTFIIYDLKKDVIIDNQIVEGQYYFLSQGDDTLYVSSTEGLYKYNKTNRSLNKQSFGFISTYGNILNVIETPSFKYFTTSSNPIIKVDKSNGEILREIDIGLVQDYEYKNGKLILKTSQGFFEEDLNGFKPIQNFDPFNKPILYLKETENSHYQITSSGLFCFNNEGIFRLPIQQLHPDNTKQFYIDEQYTFYYSNDTLYSYTLQSGSELIPPKLTMDKFFINGKITDKSIEGSTKLAHDQNNLKISFSLNDFNIDSFSFIQYNIPELEIFNKRSLNKWIELERLQPGRYSLSVVAYNAKLNKSNTYNLSITITPPFHQTWTFRILALLSMVILGFAINHLRTQKILKAQKIQLDKQKALQAQRNLMSQDLHDEMGSGLSAIRHISRSLHSNDKASDIENISAELIGNMRELLWSLDESNDTIEDLNDKIKELMNQRLRHSHFAYTLELEEDNNKKISGLKRRNTILILKEAINNAIKHSEGNKITIKSQLDDNLKLSFSDNGRGIKPAGENQVKSYGINSMKSRASRMGADFTINSTDKGTSIEVSVPLE